jgi:hypothetical protein
MAVSTKQSLPHELGTALPPGTRFCRVSGDALGVPPGTVVAFVPCHRFEQDGFYFLAAPSGPELCSCRAAPGGRRVTIASQSGNQVTSEDLFNGRVEGRVIGFALPDAVNRPDILRTMCGEYAGQPRH